tara:strand:- start:576 stop:908 length:333 start_codon:yes stop_codon:yes gene_type:complete
MKCLILILAVVFLYCGNVSASNKYSLVMLTNYKKKEVRPPQTTITNFSDLESCLDGMNKLHAFWAIRSEAANTKILEFRIDKVTNEKFLYMETSEETPTIVYCERTFNKM